MAGKKLIKKLKDFPGWRALMKGFIFLRYILLLNISSGLKKNYGDELSFSELIRKFRDTLPEERCDEFIEGLSCIPKIGHQHILTNKVRHLFQAMGKEEARSATHLLIRFFSLAGIEESCLSRFIRDLEAGNDRTTFIEQAGIIKGLNEQLIKLQKKTPNFQGSLRATGN